MHDGQVTVEDDHVVGGLRRGFQRGGAVVRGIDGHPRLAQALGDPVGKGGMVLDHQYPHLASMRWPAMTSVQHGA